MDLPPVRLSVEPASPDFNRAVLSRGVEIYLDGIRQVNCVVSYDMETGIIRRRRMTGLGVVKRDNFHQPIIDTVTGKITVEWKNQNGQLSR